MKGRSPWNTGKPLSEETKRKISASMSGRKLPKETVRKIRLSRMGYRHSDATKNKISDSQKGSKCARWKGGKTFYSNNYVMVYRPDHPAAYSGRYVPEHRLVVEKAIGRILKTCEQVHHLGAKNDNRPSMLMAFTSRSAHRRFEKGVYVLPSEIVYDGRLIGH